MSNGVGNDDFFAKVKSGLNKGLRVVNIRSREVFDTVKIKKQIGSAKKDKKKVLTEVGESVYKMFVHKDQFNEEAIREKCREVAKADQRLKDLEQELEVIHENAQRELGKLKAISKPESKQES